MKEILLKRVKNFIFIIYILLAIATPLILTTFNSELFEVPKMHFIYIAATFIFFATILKFILEKKISVPKTIPLILLLAFITSQIVSTIFSIDKFTSIFGYPSRLNGGLLSQIAYFTIFAGALINLNVQKAKKILLTIVIGALAVSLWGIPSHFGYDPSCLIFSGKLTSLCWQEDFNPTLRIFSTLGQPNWLASYLVLIIPLTLTLSLSLTNKFKTPLLITTSILFTALVMTTSLSGILSLGVSLAILLILIGTKKLKKNISSLSTLAIIFAIVVVLFGSFLYQRFTEELFTIRPNSNQAQNHKPTPPPEPRGTPSGDIRLIVWQGANDAFSNKPIFGFGPETFAYSYSIFRPLAHNQTSEWNFFYNKAHNEFLNYLAGIGIVGTSLYLLFISSCLYLLLTKSKENLVLKAIIASIIGYHASIFFGFSTVASQTIMFILLAIGIIVAGLSQKEIKLKIESNNIQLFQSAIIILLFVIVLSYPLRLIFADILFIRAQNISTSKPNTSLEIFTKAAQAHPVQDPFILAYSSYQSALIASQNQNTKLAQNTDLLASLAQKISPSNFILQRRITNAYLLISEIDIKYKQKAIESGKKLIALSPTNPESFLTLAKVYAGTGNLVQASIELETVIKLKNDYIEAKELLHQVNEQRIDN